MPETRGPNKSMEARSLASALFDIPSVTNKRIVELIQQLHGEDVDEDLIRKWKQRRKTERDTAGRNFLDLPFSWSDLVRRKDVNNGSGHYLRDLRIRHIGVGEDGKPLSNFRRSDETLTFLNRDAIWAARIHELASDLSFDDTYLLARIYSHRERMQRDYDNYNSSEVHGDLDAYITFRPWAEANSHKNYLMAMKSGTVKPLDIFELEMVGLGTVDNTDSNSERRHQLDMYEWAAQNTHVLKWKREGAPTFNYLERCGEAWLSARDTDHIPTWSVPCPYPTPVELLAWSKLFRYLEEADIGEIEGRPESWALPLWEGIPPFCYEYQDLSRLVSLMGLTQRYGLENGHIVPKGRFKYRYFERIEAIQDEHEKTGLRTLVSGLPHSE